MNRKGQVVTKAVALDMLKEEWIFKLANAQLNLKSLTQQKNSNNDLVTDAELQLAKKAVQTRSTRCSNFDQFCLGGGKD